MDGIQVDGGDDNVIAGNWLGLDATGINLSGAGRYGVFIDNASSNTLVGGVAAADRNLVAGFDDGIVVFDVASTQTRIQGNWIGVNATGLVAAPNDYGISDNGTQTLIGGLTPIAGTNAGNVISGNTIADIITYTATTVQGNIIGLGADGSTAVSGTLGIGINGNGNGATIGGPNPLARNVIGNRNAGLYLGVVDGWTIQNNYIGTDISGTLDRSNFTSYLYGPTNLSILDNVWVNRPSFTFNAVNSSNWTIQGNKFGTNATGTASLAAGATSAIVVANSSNINVGGSLPGQGNQFATGANFQVVAGGSFLGNTFGLDAAGTGLLTGTDYAISLYRSGNFNIGDGTAGGRNVMAASNGAGYSLIGSLGFSSANNSIRGNWIGLNSTGTTALGNQSWGIVLEGTTSQTTIGGPSSSERNVIGQAALHGIYVNGIGYNNSAGGSDLFDGGLLWLKGEGNTNTSQTPGFNGVANGTVGYGTGVVPATQALLFDRGNPGYVRSDWIVYRASAANFSAEAWINPATLPALTEEYAVASQESDDSPNAMLFLTRDAGGVKLALRYFTSTGVQTVYSAPTNLVADDYRHVGVTADGITARFYIDGVEHSTAAIIGSPTLQGTTTTQDAIFIGGGPGATNRTFDGRIDEGAVYARALTAAEIARVFRFGGATHGGNWTRDNIIENNYVGLLPDGSTLGSIGGEGIYVRGSENNTVRGNTIAGAVGSGLKLEREFTTDTIVAGNYVGTNATSDTGLGNSNGIKIEAGAHHNTIGGTLAAARNVISGNTSSGILLQGVATSFNTIQGNYIGTDKDGVTAIPNSEGISIANGANNNTIGGAVGGATNVISGNVVGVHVSDSNGNTVAGNIVGLQSDGLSALPNTDTGIYVNGNSNNTTIGGESLTMAFANYIGGSGGYGIALLPTPGTTGNKVVGNVVGLNQSEQIRGNTLAGIIVKDTSNVTIGGTTAGSKNVISGSSGSGVWIYNASNTTVQGNFIGTDSSGELDRGNIGAGIAIETASFGNTIGGITAAARNVISGNDIYGVGIHHVGSINNLVQGNYIGTNQDGSIAIPNGSGIEITLGAANNTIGGATAAERNIISGNSADGVILQGAGTDGNRIFGNYIGTDVSGNFAIGNNRAGVLIYFGPANNFIGTNGDDVNDATEGNLISGNNTGGNSAGVRLDDNAVDNVIAGNRIGTNADGTAAVANDYGIWVRTPTVSGTRIGTNFDGTSDAAERNIIAGNTGTGVFVDQAFSTLVTGNYIGVDSTGSTALPNSYGVVLSSGAHDNTIGGTSATARNIISGNQQRGILLSDLGTTNNLILGNYIGTDADGRMDLGNTLEGIAIIDGASSNFVGGASNGSGNVISGNNQHGILININANNNEILGNTIGLNAAGNAPLFNSGDGVHVSASSGTILGGPLLQRNIISGNASSGVKVTNASSNTTIGGNFIGTDKTGTLAIGNAANGVFVDNGSTNTTIGGLLPAQRNIISGNLQRGVRISGASSNFVLGNYIGTDDAGANDLGNAGLGIVLDAGSASNDVRLNVVSGNDGGGILVQGAATNSNILTGNHVGISANGASSLSNGRLGPGNARYGITIDGATNNRVGGTIAADRNWIGGNIGDGIVLENGANLNVIQGNWLGVNQTDSQSLPNTSHAIHLLGTGTINNSIGGLFASTGNLLAYSGGSALRLEDLTSTTFSGNIFENNILRDNLGMAIDIGSVGPTLNDGADGTSDLRDYPVLTETNVDRSNPLDPRLIVKGFAQPGRRIDLYTSAPSGTGRGQGDARLASLLEGNTNPNQGAIDLDSAPGSYGAPDASGIVGANRFHFSLPLPSGIDIGSILTGLSIGSISEFGNLSHVGLSLADTLNNLAPVVTLGPNRSLLTGSEFVLDGKFVDDDSQGWIVTVDYGDGSGVQPISYNQVERTFRLEHVYSKASLTPYVVTVSVRDLGGKVGSASMLISVINENPVLTDNQFTITRLVDEGGLVTLQGLFSDTGLTDQHVVTIDWGDGNIVDSSMGHPDVPPIVVGARTFTATHTYRDDEVINTARDTYSVVVTITDGTGNDATPVGLFIEEVLNVRPFQLTASVPAQVTENTLFHLAGSFLDPGLLDAHTVIVDWGDGTPAQTLSLPSIVGQTLSRTFDLTHKYADNPEAPATAYEIQIEVVDDDEPLSPTTLRKQVSVLNATPVITSVVLSQPTIDENQSVTLDVGWSDLSPEDSHRLVIDWGDGTEETVRDFAAGTTSVSGLTHVYRDDPSGSTTSYTIRVQVADDDMASGVFSVATTPITVNNVAPVVLSPLALFTRDPVTHAWVEYTSPGTLSIQEGDWVRVTGSYSDVGPDDVPAIQVTWSSGRTTQAVVDPLSKTFSATFRYTDDYGIGTASDTESISAVADDQDGGVSSAVNRAIQVHNVAPIASFLPAPVTNQNLIPLVAEAFDVGNEIDPGKNH